MQVFQARIQDFFREGKGGGVFHHSRKKSTSRYMHAYMAWIFFFSTTRQGKKNIIYKGKNNSIFPDILKSYFMGVGGGQFSLLFNSMPLPATYFYILYIQSRGEGAISLSNYFTLLIFCISQIPGRGPTPPPFFSVPL